MGHPDSATMAQMFAKRFSGRSQKPVLEVLKKFKCDLCERRKAMPWRPRTALPREPLFKHTVGMDVWFLRQHPVLHFCCLLSRYSQGAVLQSKEAVNVSRAFLDKWIKYFGVPGVVLTDLGAGFENEVIHAMADRYGIQLKTAASGAHWSMGGVERQHTKLGTLSETLLEVYPSMSLSECGDWAHMGKNYFPIAKLGYSPHQIVFGVRSRWPDYDDCDLPALGSYEVAADHVGYYMIHLLSQMYKMRELFHAADVKSMMREAERFQGAPKHDVVLTQGDRIYYYHEPPKQGIVSWKGPAVVVGVDAGLVLVKHGGGVKRLPTIAVRHEAWVVGDRPDPDLEGDVAENPSQEAPDVEEAHTRIVLLDVSKKKRFVVPSVDVDDSLDVGPEGCDEAGNVITWDEVHVNGVPDFLAFVAHGKPLNMHGCVEAARRSVVRVTELSKQLRQQGTTVPQVVNTFCAESQDKLVLFAFCLANMALKRKKSHGEVSAARAAEPDFLKAKQRELAS